MSNNIKYVDDLGVRFSFQISGHRTTIVVVVEGALSMRRFVDYKPSLSERRMFHLLLPFLLKATCRVDRLSQRVENQVETNIPRCSSACLINALSHIIIDAITEPFQLYESHPHLFIVDHVTTGQEHSTRTLLKGCPCLRG